MESKLEIFGSILSGYKGTWLAAAGDQVYNQIKIKFLFHVDNISNCLSKPNFIEFGLFNVLHVGWSETRGIIIKNTLESFLE